MFEVAAVINVPKLPQYKMASIATIDSTFSTPKMNDRDINNFNLVGLIALQVLLLPIGVNATTFWHGYSSQPEKKRKLSLPPRTCFYIKK